MNELLIGAAPAVAALTGKVTLLLLLALALGWLARRGSPGTLHLLWTTTFAIVLVLPLLGFLAPSWNVQILPTPETEAPVPAAESPPVVEAAALTTPEAVAVSGPENFDVASSSAVSAAVGQSSPFFRNPFCILFIAWVLGCAGSLASLAGKTLRLRALVRAARPLQDPDWLRQAAVLKRRTGIRGEVRLLTSADVTTPMTGGWRRPVILLPEVATEWSPDQRDVVLTHELIHVRRRDALRQFIRRIVVALYWFHPLGWLAARRADLASERACDDEVLALGARPSEYARLLLLMASAYRPPPNVLALPFVKPSQLERRIVSILNCKRPRASVARSAVAVIVLGSAGISVAVAHPVPVQAPVPVEEPVPATEAAVPPPEVESTWIDAASFEGSEFANAPAAVEAMDPVPSEDRAGEPKRLEQEAIRCAWTGSDSTWSMSSRNRFRITRWHDTDRTIEQTVEGMFLCMRTHGSVVMNDELTEVRAVGADSWLLLESRGEDVRQLLITESSAGIEYEWTVDDVRRTFDAEARRWHDLMLGIMHGYQEVADIRGEESGLRGRISGHRGHISGLRGRISGHRGHVSGLRGHMSGHQGHVSGLRGRISSYRGQISSLNSAMRVAEGAEIRQALEAEIEQLEARIQEVEDEIEAYDVAGKVAEIEQQIAAYDVDGKMRALQQEIEDYDLSGKVAAIRAEIEAYDLEGKTRDIERAIEELDTDERVEAIERSLEDEIAELRRLVGSTG
ncbi:MAG: hypothetical protein OXH46_07585 [Gemmatimonadetes bacterium]|nr:hypothetical protein [Gemmatimonadota bacterium]